MEVKSILMNSNKYLINLEGKKSQYGIRRFCWIIVPLDEHAMVNLRSQLFVGGWIQLWVFGGHLFSWIIH